LLDFSLYLPDEEIFGLLKYAGLPWWKTLEYSSYSLLTVIVKMASSYFNCIVEISALLSIFSGTDGNRHRQQHGGHWVDRWATMPQLKESANLPPAPFVSFRQVELKMQG
jgi:hypothetical protein